jgi:hypothetical protein
MVLALEVCTEGTAVGTQHLCPASPSRGVPAWAGGRDRAVGYSQLSRGRSTYLLRSLRCASRFS